MTSSGDSARKPIKASSWGPLPWGVPPWGVPFAPPPVPEVQVSLMQGDIHFTADRKVLTTVLGSLRGGVPLGQAAQLWWDEPFRAAQ